MAFVFEKVLENLNHLLLPLCSKQHSKAAEGRILIEVQHDLQDLAMRWLLPAEKSKNTAVTKRILKRPRQLPNWRLPKYLLLYCCIVLRS